jgi:hypothetical protein
MDIFELIKKFNIKEINKTARNMSFMATKKAVYGKTKTVTRRLGWNNLKHGDMLWACEQCQGVGKGNKIKRIWYILTLDVFPEPLYFIRQRGYEDCVKEGFPNLTPDDFIDMFCELNKAKKCTPHTLVNRIEFAYPQYIGEAWDVAVPDEGLEKECIRLSSFGTEHDNIYKYNAKISKLFGVNDRTRRKYCLNFGGLT